MVAVPTTPDEYRRWWEANAEVSFGFCQCGCGQETKIAERTRSERGQLKGQPKPVLPGHYARSNSLTITQQTEICRRYEAGESCKALGSAFGVEPSTVHRILVRRGVARRQPGAPRIPVPKHEIERYQAWWAASTDIPYGLCWCGCGQETQAADHTNHLRHYVNGEPKRYLPGHRGRVVAETPFEAEICRRYEAGEHAGQLAAAFGCDKWSIYNVLKKHGIDRRSHREAAVRYSCDDTYFDTIDTQEKAYWLGFIGADGCVIARGIETRLLQVKLAARDFEHLFKLREALQSDYPIYPLNPSPEDPRALQISSPRLFEGLARHGVQLRKTPIHEWPGDRLPKHLLRHYLRGYFDGDGNFYIKGRQHRFNLLGQEPFLLDCQKFLMSSVGVRKTNLEMRVGCFALNYGGRHQFARIARFLYRDATLYLPRKREKIAHML